MQLHILAAETAKFCGSTYDFGNICRHVEFCHLHSYVLPRQFCWLNIVLPLGNVVIHMHPVALNVGPQISTNLLEYFLGWFDCKDINVGIKR